MESLRKVIYTLEGENTISRYEVVGEKARKELEEKQKERRGLFHCFANKTIMIEGQHYSVTYGIVEDFETGEVKDVIPTRIRFVDMFESDRSIVL